MARRILDGEAVWRSRKLRQVREPFRVHYSHWVPLAEANGVFEADPELILGRAYSMLMPSTTIEQIKDILDEFVRVGLVYRWKAKGTTWGYFVGMNKKGLLPTGTELAKYRNLPPNPPQEAYLQQDTELLETLGVVLETLAGPNQTKPYQSVPNQTAENENCKVLHSAKNHEGEHVIADNALADRAEYHGLDAEKLDKAQREECARLSRIHGQDHLLALFDAYVENLDSPPKKPLAGFLAAVPRVVASGKVIKNTLLEPEDDSAFRKVLTEIGNLSNNWMSPLPKGRAKLSEQFQRVGPEVFLSAAKRFWEQTDDFSQKLARVQWPELCEAFCDTIVSEREKAAKTAELVEAKSLELEELGRREVAEMLRQEEELAAGDPF